MNSILYLSCLVVIVSSLAWTGNAAALQNDEQFNAELARLKNIFGSDDKFSKLRNTPDLMNFYEKNANRLHLTAEQRRQGDAALSEYKTEQAKQILVEKTPQQGFWWLVVPAAIEVVTKILLKSIGA